MHILHHNFPHLSDEAGSLHAYQAEQERAEQSPGHAAELVQRLKVFLERLAPDLKALSAPGALATLSDSALEEACKGLTGTVWDFSSADLAPDCSLAPPHALAEEDGEELLRLIVGPAIAALKVRWLVDCCAGPLQGRAGPPQARPQHTARRGPCCSYAAGSSATCGTLAVVPRGMRTCA